jgi:hypothetical protein
LARHLRGGERMRPGDDEDWDDRIVEKEAEKKNTGKKK